LLKDLKAKYQDEDNEAYEKELVKMIASFEDGGSDIRDNFIKLRNYLT
jgi:hypothetical protein